MCKHLLDKPLLFLQQVFHRQHKSHILGHTKCSCSKFSKKYTPSRPSPVRLEPKTSWSLDCTLCWALLDKEYSKPSCHRAALDVIESLLKMRVLDNLTTLQDVSMAIDRLLLRKAAGKFCFPPNVIWSGNSSVLEPLHKLLPNWWEAGEIRDAKCITPQNNKGDHIWQ